MTRSSRQIALGLLVALVALTSSATTFLNHFAQDDMAIVVDDPRASDPGRWDEYLNEAYWPAPMRRDLYRPLTSLLIGVERWAGNGATFPFKVIQLTLYAASAIAVLALAMRLLSPAAAVAAGLLFAAHPVHVEAVALAVTQAEVMVGLLATLAAIYYYDRRRRGWPSRWDHAALALITLVAAHFKESGVMIPVLLMAVEAILFRTPSLWQRRRELAPLVLWQTLAVVVTVGLRSRIPFDNLSGSFVAEAFEGMSIGSRTLTMLAVVPEWLRLLLWPATLSADYSPGTLMPATTWGLDQTVGLAILVLIGILAWRLRDRAPVITFGIAWCAIGIFPVSNVLLPTGIALAERTLFLPSVGVMLAVGAFLQGLPEAFPARRRQVVAAMVAVVALVTVLGISRSRSRHTVWRNNYTMWAQTVIDVPDSYRARMALGTLLMQAGHPERAIAQYDVATRLWDRAWGPYYQLAEWLRMRGDCDRAIPAYRRVLEIENVIPAKASLVTCLVWVGDYAEAKRLAMEGIGSGALVGIFRVWLRTADSAQRVGAPPRTVTFPAGNEHLFEAVADSSVIAGPGRR